jgi:hypothetical protein
VLVTPQVLEKLKGGSQVTPFYHKIEQMLLFFKVCDMRTACVEPCQAGAVVVGKEWQAHCMRKEAPCS